MAYFKMYDVSNPTKSNLCNGKKFNARLKQLVDPTLSDSDYDRLDNTITRIIFTSVDTLPSSGKDVSAEQNASVKATISGTVVTVSYSTDILVSNEDCSNMFYNFKAVTQLDVRPINFYPNKTCYQMFSVMTNCTSINVSSMDTSNVTNMRQMFSACSSLTSIDVSHFNTSKVETLQDTFVSCSSLSGIDVSKWDVSKCNMFSGTFSSCTSLSVLDLQTWDFSGLVRGYSPPDTGYYCEFYRSLTCPIIIPRQTTNEIGTFTNTTSILVCGKYSGSSTTPMYHRFLSGYNIVLGS